MCPTPDLLREYGTGHQERPTDRNTEECEFRMKFHDLEDNIQVRFLPSAEHRSLKNGKIKPYIKKVY